IRLRGAAARLAAFGRLALGFFAAFLATGEFISAALAWCAIALAVRILSFFARVLVCRLLGAPILAFRFPAALDSTVRTAFAWTALRHARDLVGAATGIRAFALGALRLPLRRFFLSAVALRGGVERLALHGFST